MGSNIKDWVEQLEIDLGAARKLLREHPEVAEQSSWGDLFGKRCLLYHGYEKLPRYDGVTLFAEKNDRIMGVPYMKCERLRLHDYNRPIYGFYEEDVQKALLAHVK